MRQITKDIQFTIDGNPISFRLTKPDAFSGVAVLRLAMKNEARAMGARAWYTVGGLPPITGTSACWLIRSPGP